MHGSMILLSLPYIYGIWSIARSSLCLRVSQKVVVLDLQQQKPYDVYGYTTKYDHVLGWWGQTLIGTRLLWHAAAGLY